MAPITESPVPPMNEHELSLLDSMLEQFNLDLLHASIGRHGIRQWTEREIALAKHIAHRMSFALQTNILL